MIMMRCLTTAGDGWERKGAGGRERKKQEDVNDATGLSLRSWFPLSVRKAEKSNTKTHGS